MDVRTKTVLGKDPLRTRQVQPTKPSVRLQGGLPGTTVKIRGQTANCARTILLPKYSSRLVVGYCGGLHEHFASYGERPSIT